MPKPKRKPLTEAQKKYIPDLLASNILVEVIKIDREGGAVKKDMEYGVWKGLKKQKGFTYRAYQKGFSQFCLE